MGAGDADHIPVHEQRELQRIQEEKARLKRERQANQLRWKKAKEEAETRAKRDQEEKERRLALARAQAEAEEAAAREEELRQAQERARKRAEKRERKRQERAAQQEAARAKARDKAHKRRMVEGVGIWAAAGFLAQHELNSGALLACKAWRKGWQAGRKQKERGRAERAERGVVTLQAVVRGVLCRCSTRYLVVKHLMQQQDRDRDRDRDRAFTTHTSATATTSTGMGVSIGMGTDLQADWQAKALQEDRDRQAQRSQHLQDQARLRDQEKDRARMEAERFVSERLQQHAQEQDGSSRLGDFLDGAMADAYAHAPHGTDHHGADHQQQFALRVPHEVLVGLAATPAAGAQRAPGRYEYDDVSAPTPIPAQGGLGQAGHGASSHVLEQLGQQREETQSLHHAGSNANLNSDISAGAARVPAPAPTPQARFCQGTEAVPCAKHQLLHCFLCAKGS